MRTYILLFCFIFTPQFTFADLYKCTGSEGTISYSDSPCSGQENIEVLIDNRPDEAEGPTATGLRPGEHAFLREIEQRRIKALREREQRRRISAQQEMDRKSRQKTCEKYRQKIKEYKDELRSGYSISRGNYLEEKMTEYRERVRKECR